MTRIPDAALADLRARNPVAEVAERLGVRLRQSGRTLVGSCPMCGGGRSAQRFEVKTADTWVCAVCQDGGDAIRLVERATGLDFRDAVDWLGGVAEVNPAVEERMQRDRAADRERRDAESERHRQIERQRLWSMWRASAPIGGTPAAFYLAGRAINPTGLRLRYGPVTPYYHGQSQDERGRTAARRIHRGPALLAPIVRPDGRFTGLHITWLAPDGDGKATIADPDTGEVLPAKKMRGSIKGGRIEVIARPEATRIVMGEGIETVLSAADLEHRRRDTAYWSALDLGNLGGPARDKVAHPTLKLRNGHAHRLPGPQPDFDPDAIPLPDGVAELVLLGDGDSDRFATETSLRRATLRYARRNRTIRHAWAPEGMDFNDLLRAEAGGGAVARNEGCAA